MVPNFPKWGRPLRSTLRVVSDITAQCMGSGCRTSCSIWRTGFSPGRVCEIAASPWLPSWRLIPSLRKARTPRGSPLTKDSTEQPRPLSSAKWSPGLLSSPAQTPSKPRLTSAASQSREISERVAEPRIEKSCKS